jgi:hypothetical protein
MWFFLTLNNLSYILISNYFIYLYLLFYLFSLVLFISFILKNKTIQKILNRYLKKKEINLNTYKIIFMLFGLIWLSGLPPMPTFFIKCFLLLKISDYSSIIFLMIFLIIFLIYWFVLIKFILNLLYVSNFFFLKNIKIFLLICVLLLINIFLFFYFFYFFNFFLLLVY